jgi:hypothetical protein
VSEVARKAEIAEKAVSLRKSLEAAVTYLAQSERDLWMLRLQEVDLWQSVGGPAKDDRSAKIKEQVIQVLDRRDSSTTNSLARIRTIDDAYNAVERKSADREQAVAAARRRFEAAEAEIQRALVEDPSIVKLDKEEKRLKHIKSLNANWREELDALIDERVATYNADRFFAYLQRRGFGTEQYQAKWPFSVLDAKLAYWSRYEEELAHLHAVLSYPDQYAEDIKKLDASLAKIEPARKAAIRAIKARLDPEREILADALNSAAEVVSQFEGTKESKSAAFKRIEDGISGEDDETKLITEAVVALLARARASAALHADDQTIRQISARVDALVKNRIAVARETDTLRNKAMDILNQLSDLQNYLDEVADKSVGAERLASMVGA